MVNLACGHPSHIGNPYEWIDDHHLLWEYTPCMAMSQNSGPLGIITTGIAGSLFPKSNGKFIGNLSHPHIDIVLYSELLENSDFLK